MCGDGDATDDTLEHDGREQCLLSLLLSALPLSPHFDRDPVLRRLRDPNVTGPAGDVEEE